MQRINWADPSLSGGLFEKIVGCLLGIEHPESVRVRPSQGDGGVDVLIPVGPGVIDVFQAKHYPDQIHWTKVSSSLASLVGGTWMDRTIRTWHLTVPKQPTQSNLAKLAELTEGLPFEALWFGEDKLVALSALHPEVGDYYLGDGRAQLERCITDWDSCLERMHNGEAAHVEDVQERLTEIVNALGRNDPHFKYGIVVHPLGVVSQNSPDAVLTTTSAVDDHLVSSHVYPRYRGAVADAGDRTRWRLDLTPAAAARVAETIAVGGKPVELSPSDIVGYEMPALGHQVPAAAEMFARLVPLTDATPAEMRLVLVTKEGNRVVTQLSRRSLVRGTEGATTVWESPGRCVELTSVVRGDDVQVTMSAKRVAEFNGPVSEIVGDLKLLGALRPGSTAALALNHGPLDLAKPFAEVKDFVVDPDFLSMFYALQVIQEYTATAVMVPETISYYQLENLVETAALLDGLTVTHDMRDAECSFTLPKTALEPGEIADVFAGHFGMTISCQTGPDIALPHQTIQLARKLLFIRAVRSARVATIVDTGDDSVVRVTLEPGAIPLWIDRRVESHDDCTDELHFDLLSLDVAIAIEDLVAQLALRATRGM